MDIETIELANYDTIPVDEILAYLYMMGIITDVNDPNKIAYTMEAFNIQPVITVPVLKGAQGIPGANAIALHFRNQLITDLDQLPTDLGDTNADLGRFWLYPVVDLSSGDKIATIIYLWTGVKNGPLSGITGLGQGWVQIPVGVPGPPGPYPNLSQAQLALTEPGNGEGPDDSSSWVAVNDGGVQFLTVTGTLTAGHFELIVDIGSNPQTTTAIQYNQINAATLQSTLEAVSTVGAGNVMVSEIDNEFIITFAGSIDSHQISQMVVTASTLVGGTVAVEIGTAENPAAAWYLAVPEGEQGPTCPLGGMFNVDFVSQIPSPGDVFTCSDRTTPGPPTGLAAVASTTGGLMVAGTYHYKVTACLPNGETLASNEVSATTTGSTGSVQLTWTAPNGNGATGYRVYRGTTAGGENLLVAVIISGTQVSFLDMGGPTSNGAPPTTPGFVAGKEIWVPVTPLPQSPLLFTIPQTAFVASEIGLEFGSQQPTIGTFNMPQQPFAWVPFIMGQVQVSADNLGLTPLLVGANVLLGNSSRGQMIASGVSDAQGFVTMIANFGSLSFSANNYGGSIVPAMHTGTTGTLYVNLVNEGWISLFDYTNDLSSLSVLVLPILNTVGIVASQVNASMAKMPAPTVAVH